MSDAASPSAPSAAPAVAWHVAVLDWVRANPVPTALWATLVATLAVFYAGVPLFSLYHVTVMGWAWSAWNPETHYEHGPLVPVIALGLVWFAWPRLRALRAEPANLGMVPLGFGVLLYVLGARTLQPRICLFGLPFVLLGVGLYLYGRRAARLVLFPLVCLFFMIPVPGVDQATVRLQLFAAKAAQLICSLIGLKLAAVGTSLTASDGEFSFEIAEGCSGINSLMAITLMTAVFAHLTQDRLWKKLLLFAGSIPVAIVGNIARLVSIMVVAKVFGQRVAGGWFHDSSAYLISFPFAFGSLCLLNKILNWPGNNTAADGGKPVPTRSYTPPPAYDY